VSKLPTQADGLLGIDILDRIGAEINLEKGELMLNENHKAPACNATSAKHTALTVFCEQETGSEPQVARSVEPHLDRQSLDDPCSTWFIQSSKSWLVKATESVTISPRSCQVISARIELGKGQNCPPLVYVEPAAIPHEGILPARMLSRVEVSENEKSQQVRALVMLANFSHETLTLPKSTVLGIAEEVSEDLINRINEPI
jgi:hypothetical protein